MPTPKATALALLLIIAVAPGAARAGEAPFQRTLRVNGHGEAHVAPDIARVQIGVTTEAATAQEALSQNTRQMNELVARVKELGIASKDLGTSGFSIGPRYARDGHSIVGYQVSNGVTVTIRDIAKAGPLLDKVVSAGANQVSGISFDVSDSTALLTEARKQAVADAHAKAAELAAGTGTKLGPVLTIEEGGGGPIPRPMRGLQVACRKRPVPQDSLLQNDLG